MPSVYEIVTESIIKQLESGVVPWKRPWVTEFPKSLRSLKEYRGLNVLMLASQGYSSPYWLTLNQANSLGGKIRKGEHSTLVTFWKRSPYTKRDVETGEEERRNGFLLRYYRVFNVEQTEGIAAKLGLSSAPVKRIPDIDQCERILSQMPRKPSITMSSMAWYKPFTDVVGLPPRDTFDSAESYYATSFHELSHSTGHPSRLGRFDGAANPTHFGSDSYSKEELIAELSSAFLCGIAGISPSTLGQSASYLQSWIGRLRGDSRLLVSAASAAQKSADFILGKSHEQESKSEQEIPEQEEVTA